MARTATLTRKTSETEISVTLDLDGSGRAEIDTGIGFLDHMLTAVARHGLIDLTVRARATCISTSTTRPRMSASSSARPLPRRWATSVASAGSGMRLIPMDETLAEAAVDISGRPFLAWNVEFERPKIGEMDTELFEEFFARSPSTPWSRCTSRGGPAITPITLPKPVSRPPRVRCAWRWSRSAGWRRDPLHQGRALKIYTVLVKAGREPVLMSEGFAWGAFFLGPLWLAAHRAWIAAAISLAAYVLIAVLAPRRSGSDPDRRAALFFWVFMAMTCARWALEHRGYTLLHVRRLANGGTRPWMRLMTHRPDLAARYRPEAS